jgi:predicted dehydrogenase
MPETVRVGIIGAGKIAQARHIPLLQKVDDVEVTHAWSRTPETARKAASEFGIPTVVGQWQKIVESPDIDAVVIGTPPNMHLPVTLAALDAGKHVLCQARMARNLSEALKMLEASRGTDLVTGLYAAGFGLKGDMVMRRLLDGGYVGDVLEVRVTSLVSSPAKPRTPEVVGVNTMMLGILAEVYNRWLEPPVSVTATTGEDLLAVPQSLAITAELRRGGTASYHLSFRVTRGPGNSVEIYGTRGVLDYRLLIEKPGGLVEDEELFGMTEGDDEMQAIEMPVHEQRSRTMDAEFIRAIREGTAMSPDFAEGVRYMEFCEAVAQSIYEGRTIEMPPKPKMDSWGRPL